MLETNVPAEMIQAVDLAPSVAAALAEGGDVAAESSAQFFELFVQSLTSGPAFSALSAERQAIASEKVRAGSAVVVRPRIGMRRRTRACRPARRPARRPGASSPQPAGAPEDGALAPARLASSDLSAPSLPSSPSSRLHRICLGRLTHPLMAPALAHPRCDKCAHTSKRSLVRCVTLGVGVRPSQARTFARCYRG